jgi:diguanylate cyclase (GGDEF)-like protein/PAS domain S-box-containing protein
MSTILILDDSTTNRHIYSRLARSLRENADIRAFADPEQAFDFAADNPIDLVITDYKMPKMDGAEFTQRLRGRPSGADVPVIVVTAYTDRDFRMKALEAGATDFLLSPVDHSEFVTRARNLLRLRAQQQRISRRAAELESELAASRTAQEKLLRDSREALAQVIDTVPAMISATDREGRCILVNALQASAAGGSPAELAGRPIAEVLGADRAEHSLRLDRVVFDTGQPLPAREEEVTGADGQRRVLLTSKAPLRDAAGLVAGVLTTALDITERRSAERLLRHMALHDPLTDLPNRTLLRERLRRQLARGRGGYQFVGLCVLDIDRFKAVNDGYGHARGDELLIQVARRLIGLVRPADTVARLGGDEFAILQAELADPGDAAVLADRLVAGLAEPFEGGGQAIGITASLGVAIAPRDGTDADELLRNADLAMYRAKAAGRNGWRFSVADLNRHARRAAEIEADLRGGVARGEFVLHYQPQLALADRRIVGAEALLRWRRPGHGLLRPAEFLGLAEEAGLIVSINEWVLREACRQAAVWQRAGLAPLRIAVNLSPVQFRRQDVVALVAEVLRESGLDPGRLDLEITEGILMGDVAAVGQQLRALRALGVGLSLDDFGTGYSSLSYIRSFPLDRLKIDRSFTRGIDEPGDLAIVRTIIELGRALGLVIVAEGVETAEQLEVLRAEGCDEVQGNYFAAPLPPEAFAGRLPPAASVATEPSRRRPRRPGREPA